jgi:hypothetical protein
MIDNKPAAWIDARDLEDDFTSTSVTRTQQFDTDVPLYTQETIEEIKALWYSKGHADGAKIREDYLALRTFDGKKE